MEFYKLFHKRTNYRSMLEWIDRGFRPEKWKRHDERMQELVYRFSLSFALCNGLLEKYKETDYV